MRVFRSMAVLLALAVVATCCGGGRDDKGDSASDATVAKAVDDAALGLWDDGPCDKAKEPLRIGFMATLESSVISLKSFGTVSRRENSAPLIPWSSSRPWSPPSFFISSMHRYCA